LAAWPKARARDLVGIGVELHCCRHVGHGAARGERRGLAPRETRHCEVEAPPEKMHRAAFSDETSAGLEEHAFGLEENAPVALGIIMVVRAVDMILAEGDCIRNLVRHLINADIKPKLSERTHHLCVKIGHGSWVEFDLFMGAVARRDPQGMVDEIEVDLEA